MNKSIIFILILLNSLCLLTAGGTAKTAVAIKTCNSPVIDGTINAGEWDKAFWHNSFVACPGDAKARQQSRFAVMFDAENIYIAVKCDENHRDKLTSYSKNDINIWRYDSLEVFIQKTSGIKYQQFMVSAGGGRYAIKFEKGIQRRKEIIPYAKWQASAEMTEYGYVVEIKIPIVLFDTESVANGAEWRFNIHRNATTLDSDRYSSWSPISRFHEPADFGYLIFAVSDPQTLQRRLVLKRKSNKLVSQIENMCIKYTRFDPLFASKLNAELKNINWLEFREQSKTIMKMNKGKLDKYTEQLSVFAMNFEKLKKFRSEYLLQNFFLE